jgi:hypothetical protein
LTVDEWHYCTGTVITQLQRIHTTKSGTVAAPAHRLKPCSEPPPSPHPIVAAAPRSSSAAPFAAHATAPPRSSSWSLTPPGMIELGPCSLEETTSAVNGDNDRCGSHPPRQLSELAGRWPEREGGRSSRGSGQSAPWGGLAAADGTHLAGARARWSTPKLGEN